MQASIYSRNILKDLCLLAGGDALSQDCATGQAAIGKNADAARKNAWATMDSTVCGAPKTIFNRAVFPILRYRMNSITATLTYALTYFRSQKLHERHRQASQQRGLQRQCRSI
jgi:hypothetical protein